MRTRSFLYESRSDLLSAIEDASLDDSSATLVQVYTASADMTRLRDLLQQLRHLMPCCRIIGASSSALIHNGVVHERGLLVVLTQFDQSELCSTFEAFPADSQQDWSALGERLAARVAGDDTRLMLCFAFGATIDAEELARGLTRRNDQCLLAGALASAPALHQPFLVANDAVYPAGAVLVAIGSETLSAMNYHCQDWMMLGSPMEVTAARGNRVVSINQQPALEVFHKYIGDDTEERLEESLLRFPLLSRRNGVTVARLASGVDKEGALSFRGTVRLGEAVRFGLLNPVSTLEQLQGLETRLSASPVEHLLVFSSEARRRMMRSVTVDELGRLQALAPVDGLFTTGQFFSTPQQPDYLHYSQTVLGLAEGAQAPRAADSREEEDNFSPETLQMRAMMRLVSTTSRELETANRQLEVMVNTDSLTGASNRYKASQVLEQEILRMQRYDRPLSLILFDIDNFKQINDQYGHQQGDRVLQRLVDVASPLVRSTDLFSRWGGEEFMVVCPETSIDGAQDLAERLRLAIEQGELLTQQPVTVSLGVLQLAEGDTIDSAYTRVDDALYASKRAGKNRVTVAQRGAAD